VKVLLPEIKECTYISDSLELYTYDTKIYKENGQIIGMAGMTTISLSFTIMRLGESHLVSILAESRMLSGIEGIIQPRRRNILENGVSLHVGPNLPIILTSSFFSQGTNPGPALSYSISVVWKDIWIEYSTTIRTGYDKYPYRRRLDLWFRKVVSKS